MKLTKKRLQQIIKEEMDLESETKIPPQEILTNIIQKAVNSLDIDYDSDWEDYSGGPREISQKISEFAVELLDIMGNPEIGVDPERYHDDPRNHPEEPRPIKEKGDKWIQGAEKDIEKSGTKGVCTGDKFGGPTCKPGTKRYNLAKTFRKMGKKNKKKD